MCSTAIIYKQSKRNCRKGKWLRIQFFKIKTMKNLNCGFHLQMVEQDADRWLYFKGKES